MNGPIDPYFLRAAELIHEKKLAWKAAYVCSCGWITANDDKRLERVEAHVASAAIALEAALSEEAHV